MAKANAIDPAKMSGAQKAAIFLIAMGEDYATEIFRTMKESQMSAIALEMSRIEEITPEMLEDWMRVADALKMLADADFNTNVISNTSF
ncbi:MAG: hypothetical protein HQK67_10860 [Desulfamplus sp.]|nr:hypothetical protein [Desulfamplus sp.]